MKWSWKIGRIAGIAVYIHVSFTLLIAWVAAVYWQEKHSLQSVLFGVVFVMSVFACVLLHELGHALMARKYGIRTQDITLLPIGGLARLERIPEKPMQEFWVALAGPAVNVAIAAVLFLITLTQSTLQSISPENFNFENSTFVTQLMAVNIFMVLFNLLPAFPMDGGRVLRALLAANMPYARATNIAANCGQGMALLFVLGGLFSHNFVLMFVGLFVWMGASQEANLAEVKATLSGVLVRQAMLTEFHTLPPEATLRQAADLILAGSQHDFPIVAESRLQGILTRGRLITALAEKGPQAPVAEVMIREFPILSPDERLTEAWVKQQSSGCEMLPVLDENQLIGLLTAENVGEFVMIRTALENSKGSRLPPVLKN